MKITLGKKLAAGFAVILVFMMISSALSYRKSSEIREIEHFILTNRVPSLESILQLEDDANYAGSKSRQAILAGTDSTIRQAGMAKFNSAWERIEKTVAKLDALSTGWRHQENRDRLADIKEGLPKMRAAQQKAIDVSGSGGRDGVINGGNDYADNATPIVDVTTKTLADLQDSINKSLVDEQTQLDSANSSMAWTMGLATLVALAAGTLLAAFLSHKISSGTAAVLGLAEAVTRGDLTVEDLKIVSNDELGDLTTALNKLKNNLRKIITSMSSNAQVAASSKRRAFHY